MTMRQQKKSSIKTERKQQQQSKQWFINYIEIWKIKIKSNGIK